jgi:hypothetical protein
VPSLPPPQVLVLVLVLLLQTWARQEKKPKVPPAPALV